MQSYPRSVTCAPVLHSLIEEANPSSSLYQKLHWFSRLMFCIRKGGDGRTVGARLWVGMGILEEKPERRVAVAAVLRSILLESESLPLLAHAGIPRADSVFAEAWRRLRQVFWGGTVANCDLLDWLPRFLGGEKDLDWLQSLSVDDLRQWVRAFGEDLAPGVDFRSLGCRSLLLALNRLCSELVAPAMLLPLQVASSSEPAIRSPLIRLTFDVEELTRLLLREGHHGPDLKSAIQETQERVQAEIARCRQMGERARANLTTFGVSLDILYKLTRLELILDRCEALLEGTLALREGDWGTVIHALGPNLACSLRAERGFIPQIAPHLGLLARKISEKTASAGERVIARTRKQYFSLLRAASGGGLVTAGTVIGKYIIFWLKIPMFLAGGLVSLNYAGSFLLMHLLSFKLATKQPAILASAFARLVEAHEAGPGSGANPVQDAALESAKKLALRELLHDCASIVRSMVAIVGANLAVVAISVLLFHAGYRVLHHGKNFLDVATAHHMIQSLDPWHSLTLPFAALTGALLWLSSVAGGWFENWSVHRMIPTLLALTGRRARRDALWLATSRRTSGIASAISLGFLLGSVPMLGGLVGFPMDVRHMTLSSGALAMAICSLGIPGSMHAGLLSACLGLFMVTLLNLGVAFGLGFLVTLHAHGVDRAVVIKIFRAFRAKIPAFKAEEEGLAWRSFFLPPREDSR